MAIIEIKIPSPGESITEVTIARWLKKTGDVVEKDEPLAEIDSDKATLTLNAEESGKLEILAADGDIVKVGQIVVKIDNSFKPEKKEVVEKQKDELGEVKVQAVKVEQKKENGYASGTPSVAAAKLMRENGVGSGQMQGTGKAGRVTKQDVAVALSKGIPKAHEELCGSWQGGREKEQKKISALRKTISRRLVSVKNETAMLTTFNEVDMGKIYALRSKYKDKFKETFGVNIGFMGFFTKAVCEALFHFPAVNAMLDGDQQVFHKYCDIGIAVSAPKGLMVPVLRNAELMTLAEIESNIRNLAIKARDGKLGIPEMEGGTFTITNGGVFGSMLSTPIINPPQSAILGMHNVVERPVAINGKVEIRPVMYIALSYDHRVVDGRESVGFLVKVKEMLEDPARMVFGGKSPEELLLGL